MTKFWTTIAAVGLMAGPAFADGHAPSGDAEAGGEIFKKKCANCHVVVNDAGETLAGKKSKTGPNLYAMAGRQMGSVEGYKYGKSIVALGETGAAWDEAGFVEWLEDPTKFLRAKLDDKKARSKMSFKLKKADEAANVYAFLFSLAPPEATN